MRRVPLKVTQAHRGLIGSLLIIQKWCRLFIILIFNHFSYPTWIPLPKAVFHPVTMKFSLYIVTLKYIQSNLLLIRVVDFINLGNYFDLSLVRRSLRSYRSLFVRRKCKHRNAQLAFQIAEIYTDNVVKDMQCKWNRHGSRFFFDKKSNKHRNCSID